MGDGWMDGIEVFVGLLPNLIKDGSGNSFVLG